jgi:spore coat polysaccharide biosynthesis protein SpsF (cytidylyltransferase family)
MAGSKTFINHSPSTVSISLFVRQGDNPANQAGTVSFDVNSHESKNVQYGNSSNIFVNGYSLVAGFNGDVFNQDATVTSRGSSLDNQWNTNSVIEINFAGNTFSINAHN